MNVGYLALGAGLGAAATLLTQRLMRSRPDPVCLADDDDDVGGVSEESSDDGIEVCSKGVAAVEALRWRDCDAPLKMLLCVNVDLRDANDRAVSMTKGKTCAQCGHATLGAYRQALTSQGGRNALRVWLRTGQMKIAVRVPTQAELTALHAEAAKRGLVCSLVRDAGHTQIAPGSRTVLAIGPAPERYFDFTKHLKLL
jgi:PTH2 family peptidyl-tRNA hydrolase